MQWPRVCASPLPQLPQNSLQTHTGNTLDKLKTLAHVDVRVMSNPSLMKGMDHRLWSVPINSHDPSHEWHCNLGAITPR